MYALYKFRFKDMSHHLVMLSVVVASAPVGLGVVGVFIRIDQHGIAFGVGIP